MPQTNRKPTVPQQDEWVDVPQNGESGASDEWVDVAPQQSSVAAPSKPSFLSRAGEVSGVSSLPQLASDVFSHPGKVAKNLFLDTPNKMVYHPLDFAREVTGGYQFGEDVANKNYGAAAGDMAGGILGTFGFKAPEAMSAVRDSVVAGAKRMYATPDRAAKLAQRAIFPDTVKAGAEETLHEDLRRSGKYIADETRPYPIPSGPSRNIKVPSGNGGMNEINQAGGAVQSSRVIRRAANNLWSQSVEPVVELFADVQRPGNVVADAITGSFNDADRATSVGLRRVKAGEQLARSFNRPMSVRQMNEAIKNMNAEPGVAKYYEMSPSEQAAVERSNPALRSQVRAVEGLRSLMFDTIAESGGEKLGQQFLEARKDYGSLVNLEDHARNAKVSTPQPFGIRAANTIRGFVPFGGGNASARISGVPETLLHLQDPNRLLPRAMNMYGRTKLSAPFMDVEPQVRGFLPPAPLFTPTPEPYSPPSPPATGTHFPPGSPVPPWSAYAAPQGPVQPASPHVTGPQSPMTPIPNNMVPTQPLPTGQRALFGMEPTSPQPMEWSRGKVMGIDVKVQELLDILSDPGVSAADKALIREKLGFIPSTQVKQ